MAKEERQKIRSEGCSGTSHGRVAAATVCVRDLEAVVASYEEHLRYRVAARGSVDADFATLWAAPLQLDRRWVLLGPASGAEVYLRVVEAGPELEPPAPLRTFGWAAMELTIEDADQLHRELLESPFTILGPPQELDFSDRIYPMQAAGVEGEVFYLNQVRGSLPDYDLPVARSFVDELFIAVLAAPDIEASLAFYSEQLGFERGNTYEIPYSLINNAFGLEPTRTHKLAMSCVGRHVNIEIDEYPAEAEARKASQGTLPAGMALVSLFVDSLEAVRAPFLGGVVRLPEPPYLGRRAAVCRGAAGELVELIEGLAR
jgi:catechol 2,3-dioxygenase-like lactoylglutathione lyase family enzyme